MSKRFSIFTSRVNQPKFTNMFSTKVEISWSGLLRWLLLAVLVVCSSILSIDSEDKGEVEAFAQTAVDIIMD